MYNEAFEYVKFFLEDFSKAYHLTYRQSDDGKILVVSWFSPSFEDDILFSINFKQMEMDISLREGEHIMTMRYDSAYDDIEDYCKGIICTIFDNDIHSKRKLADNTGGVFAYRRIADDIKQMQ